MANILQAVEQQYLTKAQAQIYTGLSERTLDYARERNELKFFRVGKRVLFRRGDLDVYIERHSASCDLDKLVDDVMSDLWARK
jgi:excisionase family DNA binding protein